MSISIESTVGIIATWLYLLTVLYKNLKNKKKPSKEKGLGIFHIEGLSTSICRKSILYSNYSRNLRVANVRLKADLGNQLLS